MLLATALVLFQVQAAPGDPRAVVTEATRAIEGDSAARLATSWSARVTRDSSDWAARVGLATLARLAYDYAAADSGYQRLIRAAPSSAASYVALARLELARGLQTRGLNQLADSAYALAVRDAHRSGNAPLEASALVALASLRARTMGPATADTLLRRAGELLSPQDHLGLSEYRCARAALLQMTGRPGVESAAREGAALARQAGSARQHAWCQRVLAVAVLDRDRYAGWVMFEDVVRELALARDHAALSSVLQWRGYRRFSSFEYGAARTDLLRAAAEGHRSGAQSPLAWALLNLSQVSAWSGDLMAARRYADSAQVLFQLQGDRWGLGALHGIQGQVAFLSGDLERARTHFGAALRDAQASGYPPTIIEVEVALALLEMEEGNFREAERRLTVAVDMARAKRLPAREVGIRYHLAHLALLRGQPETAIRELNRELQGLDGSQPAVDYRVRARLAEAYMRQGRAVEAERELRRANVALDSTRAGISHEALRTVVLQSLRDVHDPHLGIPYVLAGLVAAGRANAAFELAERRKAIHLLDQLVLREALGGRSPDAVAGKESPSRPSPVTLPELASAIPDDQTAVLEYVTGTDGAATTLFVVTRSASSALRLLPLDSLIGDLRRFATMIESGEDPRDLGQKLATALLAPAIERLPAGINRLIIVPDAGLQRLAFDALTLPDGHLVAERFAVSLAPSAAVATRLWDLPAHAGPASILAFGDPRFGGEVAAGTEATVYREAFGANGGLTRLAASAGEARAVARYGATADVRLRDDASEAYLKNTPLRRFRVLHFAAHALVDEQAVTRTALALAPGGGEDGFVTAGDLAALGLDADLVVLSACRTAGGVFVRGEGVEGLTAPLLEAGARGVVASLWRVGDRSTAAFVAQFYRRLASGEATGDALAGAKREAIRRGLPPATWAAFTLVGDPTVRIPLRAPRPWWPAIALATAVLAAGYGLAIFRRRKAERT